jgi:hypothetical protein
MGILEAISKSTNVTAQTSGVAFSASILNGLMQANWTNSNGDVATDLFVGAYLRNVIDGFTQKTNTVISGAGVSTIENTVSIYQTSFGTLQVHTHRYLNVSGTDATGRALGLNRSKLKVAMLKNPYIDMDLARAGDYDSRAVVGKFTLETINQDSNFYATGYNIG